MKTTGEGHGLGYVNGPYDDPEQVVRMLLRAVGDGGFHDAVAFPSSRGAGGCGHAGRLRRIARSGGLPRLRVDLIGTA